MKWNYAIKVKNPYFDLDFDKKFVFLLYDFLLPTGINLGEKCFGLFLKDDNVAIIDTEIDYNRCMFTEVSIYEAFSNCIPEGMTYNKELDKLVPDVINVEFERVKFDDFSDNYEQILKRENGFIKADKKKINFFLVEPYAYEDLGKCLTIGAEKYNPDNWKLGDIQSYISALDRHLIDIKKAVLDKDKSLFIDKDTTLQHGANLMCNAMFIHYFIRKKLEEK